MFNRNYTTKPTSLPEINSGELIVEKGGIMTLAERVKLAQLSGYKLQIERYLQTFDTADDDEWVPVPAGRRPGFDLQDAHAHLQQIREKAKKAQQKVFEANKSKAEKEYEQRIENEVAKRILEKEKKKLDTLPVTS